MRLLTSKGFPAATRKVLSVESLSLFRDLVLIASVPDFEYFLLRLFIVLFVILFVLP